SRPPTPNTVVAYRDAYRLNDPPSGVIERFNVHTEESGSVRQRNHHTAVGYKRFWGLPLNARVPPTAPLRANRRLP
ncbi:MAG TPA: hypothetical protein VFT17_06975, partial [Propionibacteriaceae bacterium]|nr:hypothetical protein [Propionibacteriaceae bacterium]